MRLHIFFILLLLTTSNIKADEIDSLWVQRQDTTELPSNQMVLNFLQESGIPITHGNKVKLLKSGREKFEDLFEAIRGAKHHIHLEYFNFRNDSIANALFDLLAEKVKEGVEVRALFDAFGNWSNNKPLKKRHLKAIREQPRSTPGSSENSCYRRKNRLYRRNEYSRLLHQRTPQNWYMA